MKKLLIIISLILFIGFSAFTDDINPDFIVNSGHSATITALDFNTNEELLFSGGNDGSIKIWNSKTEDLRYSYQLSHMPVRMIEVCRSKPYIASILSDGLDAVNLSVHNWKTGELVFNHRMPEIPLFMLFSPQGNFLMYGKTDYDSLVFLDAETGARLDLIPEGFGIVSSAFISDSEKTLLAYNSSGSIQYWDLTNGTRKTKIPSIANLKYTSFTANGRYMTGYNGSEILLIDLLKGNYIDSIEVRNLSYAVIDLSRDKLIWTVSNGRDLTVSSTSISNTGFSNIDQSVTRILKQPGPILSYSDKIFISFENGSIFSIYSWADSMTVFSENNLLAIQDFAINDSSLSITVPGALLSVPSDLFLNKPDEIFFNSLDSSVIDTNASSSYGLSAGRGSDLLLWETESETEGAIKKINTETGEITILSLISTPLISAEYKNGRLLTLDKNGECRIIDYDSGENIFRYTSFGLRTIDLIDGNNIIAGRNSSATLPSPLLHINTRTGETVPIDDNNILIFDLEYDELTRKLYTIGFEKRNGVMRTVLKQHTGKNHDRAETILAFPGEDINAAFASDTSSSKIFTSLGHGGIKMLYWGGFTQLEAGDSIPMHLKLYRNILSALNQDSSMSIYNTSNGTKVMDIYFFKDFSWAAVFPDRTYYASEGADKYINIYDGESGKKLNNSAYRVK